MAQTDSGARALIDAVKAGTQTAVEAALAKAPLLGARDEHDWSALDWAAGRGHTATIRLLLEHGADPLETGREQRTPYQIALAAGHLDAARTLRDAEERADPSSAERHSWRPYCRAYCLSSLRRFPEWQESPAAADMDDDNIVYVHDDLTVTAFMWPGEDIIFDSVSEAWSTFCRTELAFLVPDDFDLIPTKAGTDSLHSPGEPGRAGAT